MAAAALIALGAALALTGARSPGVSAPVAPPARLRPGAIPPGLSGVAFDGSPVSLGGERGRVVLVNFFASWCAECRAEMPDIERAYLAAHGAGFDVIGVDAVDGGDGQGFYRRLGATYPALRDGGPGAAPGPIARAYGIGTGLPVSVFVGRDGRVHQTYLGRIDGATIAAELRALGIA
jgi:thiol-disulfide isomerase/thioredoxin